MYLISIGRVAAARPTVRLPAQDDFDVLAQFNPNRARRPVAGKISVFIMFLSFCAFFLENYLDSYRDFCFQSMDLYTCIYLQRSHCMFFSHETMNP